MATPHSPPPPNLADDISPVSEAVGRRPQQGQNYRRSTGRERDLHTGGDEDRDMNRPIRPPVSLRLGRQRNVSASEQVTVPCLLHRENQRNARQVNAAIATNHKLNATATTGSSPIAATPNGWGSIASVNSTGSTVCRSPRAIHACGNR